MPDKNNLKEFCEMHDIRILDTNKRKPYYKLHNLRYFENDKDYNSVTIDPPTLYTETVYTVEIPETQLNRIADFQSEVFNHMKSQGHYNMFETIMEQKEKEKFLRDHYPAVKKAYEHYSLILKMAMSGEYDKK